MKSLQDCEMGNDEHTQLSPESPSLTELPEFLDRVSEHERSSQKDIHPFYEQFIADSFGRCVEETRHKGTNH